MEFHFRQLRPARDTRAYLKVSVHVDAAVFHVQFVVFILLLRFCNSALLLIATPLQKFSLRSGLEIVSTLQYVVPGTAVVAVPTCVTCAVCFTFPVLYQARRTF